MKCNIIIFHHQVKRLQDALAEAKRDGEREAANARATSEASKAEAGLLRSQIGELTPEVPRVLIYWWIDWLIHWFIDSLIHWFFIFVHNIFRHDASRGH